MSEQLQSQVDPRVDALRLAATSVSLSAGADIWTEILTALDEADRAVGIARVRVVRSARKAQHDPQGNFIGFDPSHYEHRSAGGGRAWSFEAGEWCYAHRPCEVCGAKYAPLEESGD